MTQRITKPIITIPMIIFLTICIVSILTFCSKISKSRDKQTTDSERGGVDVASGIVVALGFVIYVGIYLFWKWMRIDQTALYGATRRLLKSLPLILLFLTIAETIPLFRIIDSSDRTFVILNICISCVLVLVYSLGIYFISTGDEGGILNFFPCDDQNGWRVLGTIATGLLFVSTLLLIGFSLKGQSSSQDKDNKKIRTVRLLLVLSLCSLLTVGLCLERGEYRFLTICSMLFIASLIGLIVLWIESQRSKEVITLDSIITIIQTAISLFIAIVFALCFRGTLRWIAIIACLATCGFGVWSLIVQDDTITVNGENTLTLFRKLFYLMIFIVYIIALCPQSIVYPMQPRGSNVQNERRSSTRTRTSSLIKTDQFWM